MNIFSFVITNFFSLVIVINLKSCVTNRVLFNNSFENKNNNYNYELEAIRQGKEDYQNNINSNYLKKSLLCVTFIELDNNFHIDNNNNFTLFENIKLLKNYCDWAIVIYYAENGCCCCCCCCCCWCYCCD